MSCFKEHYYLPAAMPNSKDLSSYLLDANAFNTIYIQPLEQSALRYFCKITDCSSCWAKHPMQLFGIPQFCGFLPEC